MVAGAGTGAFTATIEGLRPQTDYHVRAFATNQSGTAYGENIPFTTLAPEPDGETPQPPLGETPEPPVEETPEPPVEEPTVIMVTTGEATTITYQSAVLSGTLNDATGVSAQGFAWSTTNTVPDTSDNLVTTTRSGLDFIRPIAGLAQETTHYVRAFAANPDGVIAWGNTVSFTTLTFLTGPIMNPPVVSTEAVTDSGGTITVSGQVLFDGNSPVTDRGFVYGTSPNPTLTDTVIQSGSGTGQYSATLSGLAANTTYYIRAFATNSEGTGYGNVLSAISNNIGPVTVTAVETNIIVNDFVSLDFSITSDFDVNNVVFGLFPVGSSPTSAEAVEANANKRTRNLVANTAENLLISQSSASTGNQVLTSSTTYELWFALPSGYVLSDGSRFGKLLDASTEALMGTIGVVESYTADGETRAFQYRANERMLVSFVLSNYDSTNNRLWADGEDWIINRGVSSINNNAAISEVVTTSGTYTIVTFVKSTYQFSGDNLGAGYIFDVKELPLVLD